MSQSLPPTSARDSDLVGKLLSAGFTLLGLVFPLMVATIGLMRASDLLAADAPSTVRLILVIAVGLILCMAQLLVCLATLVGRIAVAGPALWLTVALVIYLSLGTAIWALVEAGVI